MGLSNRRYRSNVTSSGDYLSICLLYYSMWFRNAHVYLELHNYGISQKGGEKSLPLFRSHHYVHVVKYNM